MPLWHGRSRGGDLSRSVDMDLELGWRYKVMDHSMPFMIQTMKEIGQRLIGLEEEIKEKRYLDEEERQNIDDEVNDDVSVLLFVLNQ